MKVKEIRIGEGEGGVETAAGATQAVKSVARWKAVKGKWGSFIQCKIIKIY